MDENKKNAVIKFLNSVKGAVMSMAVESLSDSALQEVCDNFATMMEVVSEDSSSSN